ncbi:MAG: biopolymer transporter ExbD [Elusimicrobia bacterium]|nr:biopolymer transporter ExbD [Elusimicrobiota bacterium]
MTTTPNPWGREEDPAPIADVNVVPLADVSLVLLILLLVLAPMTSQSMLRVQSSGARAPAAGETTSAPGAGEPALILLLSRAGWAAEDGPIGDDAALRAWLAPRLARRGDKRVFLAPEPDVPNGRLVSGVEALQDCGAAVALVQARDEPQAR